MNRSLVFGADTVSLEVQNFADGAVLLSIAIPLAVWNLLESQSLWFLEDAISGARLTEDEQARPYEENEQANVPNLLPNHAMLQDALRCREGQEIVFDNSLTTDSDIGTMSPGTSTVTKTTNVSPSTFYLAIDCYGFDYPVWTDNSGDDVDVHGLEHFYNDEEDEEDRDKTTPAADHENDDNQPQRLKRNNGTFFQRFENITDSVIRSLFQYGF